ncbi:hypothetical protein DNTS_004705 [Danionella cerebrum]|uniref:Uncharacterized protein n=1 Tax=Danionella cerebrum TaxID=2873325 RepID=A0A553RCQ3_9TELE|nr:hypothetical protein DNTS_004705 [Danionella translucida]
MNISVKEYIFKDVFNAHLSTQIDRIRISLRVAELRFLALGLHVLFFVVWCSQDKVAFDRVLCVNVAVRLLSAWLIKVRKQIGQRDLCLLATAKEPPGKAILAWPRSILYPEFCCQ